MGVGIWLSMGGLWWRAVVYAALCIIFFPLASILHELGHKFFGLFGSREIFVIPWACIRRVGGDLILVDVKPEEVCRPREKRKLFF